MLIDFGAVKEIMGTSFDSQGHSQQSIVIGTSGYMATEQAVGRPMYTSDLYSLGMVAIYLLTGKRPHELDTNSATGKLSWSQAVNHVSQEFRDFIDHAIMMQAQYRFPTAVAMGNSLKYLLQEQFNPLQRMELSIHAISMRRQSPINTVVAMNGSPSEIGGCMHKLPNPHTNSIHVQATSWRKATLTIGIGVGVVMGAVVTQWPPLTLPPESLSRFTPMELMLPDAVGAVVAESAERLKPKPIPISLSPRSIAPGANATVMGSRTTVNNVRSGPGMYHEIVAEVYGGDQVRVQQMQWENYHHRWYEITLPQGDIGWIAGQRLQINGNEDFPKGIRPEPPKDLILQPSPPFQPAPDPGFQLQLPESPINPLNRYQKYK